MRNTLKTIYITVRELASLFFTNQRTLHTWITRNNTPDTFQPYLIAIKHYRQHYVDQSVHFQDWQQVLSQDLTQQFNERHQERQENQLVELQQELRLLVLEEKKLAKKWQSQLQRLHFAQHYGALLPHELYEQEHTAAWIQLIARESRFKLEEIRQQQQKVKLRLVSVRAQLAFLQAEVT